MLATRHNVRAHFWQSLANYTQQFGGIALGIILARLLTPSDFGTIAFASAFVALVLLPANWSLAQQVVAEGNRNPLIIGDAWHFSRFVTLARFGLLVAACAWLWIDRGSTFSLIGFVCGLPMALAEPVAVMRASLESAHDFKPNAMDAVLTVVVTATLSVPLALAGTGVWALALPAIPLFFLQFALFKKWSKLRNPPRSNKRRFQSAASLYLASTSELALTRLDKVFLGQFSDTTQVGNYNRAYNYAPISVRAMNSLVTNPTVSALARLDNSQKQLRLLLKSGALLVLGGLINFILWWWFSDPLVPWIFGEQWREAIPVFQAFAPLSLVISAAYLPTTLLIARRQYSVLAAIRMGTIFVFAGIALWLGSKLSAERMAYLLQLTLLVQATAFFAALGFKMSRQN